MAYVPKFQNLPEKLSQPGTLAIVASIGIHAVVLAAIPILPLAGAKEKTQRLVQLVDLSGVDANRGPNLSAPPQPPSALPTPPGTTALLPSPSSKSAFKSSATPSPLPTRKKLPPLPRENPVAFKMPDLPPIPPFPTLPNSTVTLPPISIPTPSSIPSPPPRNLPTLEQPSFVLPVAPNPSYQASLDAQVSRINSSNRSYQDLISGSPPPPPRIPNSYASPNQDIIPPGFSGSSNPPASSSPPRGRQIPDLSEYSQPPQIPNDYNFSVPPERIATPPSPSDATLTARVPASPYLDNLRVSAPETFPEGSVSSSNPQETARTMPNSLREFSTSPEVTIERFESTPSEEEASGENSSSNSEQVAVNSPNLSLPANSQAPVLSEQRQQLVAQIRERREMLVEDTTNTTPGEANRNWLSWVEAVKETNPGSIILSGTYPQDACLKKIEGTSVYGVVVNGEGAIADVELIKSSGYPLLNQQARRDINSRGFSTSGASTPYQVTVEFKYNDEICPSLAVPESTPLNKPATPAPASAPAPVELQVENAAPTPIPVAPANPVNKPATPAPAPIRETVENAAPTPANPAKNPATPPASSALTKPIEPQIQDSVEAPAQKPVPSPPESFPTAVPVEVEAVEAEAISIPPAIEEVPLQEPPSEEN